MINLSTKFENSMFKTVDQPADNNDVNANTNNKVDKTGNRQFKIIQVHFDSYQMSQNPAIPDLV